MERNQYDAVIAGAGASGMLCALLLSRQGRSVAIVEKNSIPGKKLSATGNGRCNFTNLDMSADCYRSISSEITWMKTVLSEFDAGDCCHLFEDLGILWRQRDGYVYPYSNQASTVVETLYSSCIQYGVCFYFEEKVTHIQKSDCFTIRTSHRTLFSENLVLATGGKAAKSLGGDGSGYRLGRSMGHSVTGLTPGLTGFYSDSKLCQSMAGVRISGKLMLLIDGEEKEAEIGEIQITKDRVSGIPAFQLCHTAGLALQDGCKVELLLDFVPDMTIEQCTEFLVKHNLRGIVNSKCIPPIERMAKGKNPASLARACKAFLFPVSGTAGFEMAQVTVGGILLDEVFPQSFESKRVKGLYLLGELLDIDGKCGGYNLHFAWAGAYLAAKNMAI